MARGIVVMPGRLLIVSPEDDLRRSLQFALQAEGFSVVAVPTAIGMTSSRFADFECLVMDEKSVDIGSGEPPDLARAGRPVVLLADHPEAVAAPWIGEVVEKPLRGGAVARAVRNLLVATREPTK
jgi:hypothetical protein